MKGILLAGGAGTRLHPLTQVITKQLLPVYDKPMVYYPLSTLMLAGIREILLISTPQDIPNFERLLGDGSSYGLSIRYKVQPRPEGIAQALILAEEFLAGDSCVLILGDNLFYGSGMQAFLESCRITEGALIFAYPVHDPQRYGVVEFDKTGRVLSIEEKPSQPRSSYAIPGLYFYDGEAPALARTLRPSSRGELEITDLNKLYLERGALRVRIMPRGFAWLDTGTPRSLLEASLFVQVIEERQGLKIGCIEEIAFRKGFISLEQLRQLASRAAKTPYGQYLLRVIREAEG
ncbi:MAG: glucose-1-phosphate thymidylyltransferase RfbA [Bacteroidia bacterium]|nr:glucose-1-phosphate thymidylyltransferase RfbA [Bacteroidia bacterium]MCX7652641.1 glucose-1-phosphate thymidylyltransferase RfbA [Bacteroidia bacterium]MDW8417006.1 glucose-1-phosphate thymidylyltransferase RfbA [Bacteroidia bacterium]